MSDASERAPPPKCALSKAIGHLAVLCATWRSNVPQGKLSFVSPEGPLTRSRTLHYRTLRFDHLQDRGNRVFKQANSYGADLCCSLPLSAALCRRMQAAFHWRIHKLKALRTHQPINASNEEVLPQNRTLCVKDLKSPIVR